MHLCIRLHAHSKAHVAKFLLRLFLFPHVDFWVSLLHIANIIFFSLEESSGAIVHILVVVVPCESPPTPKTRTRKCHETKHMQVPLLDGVLSCFVGLRPLAEILFALLCSCSLIF